MPHTKRKTKRPLTSKKAATTGYQPIDQRWWQRPRDLPPFTFLTIRAMLLDPTIRLGLAMRAAPLCSAEFAYKRPGAKEYTEGIQADDPIVAAFVLRQLKRLWTDIGEVLRSQVWGWSGGEVMLRHVAPNESKSGRHFIEFDRLLPRHAGDIRAMLCDGEVKKIRFLRITGDEMPDGHVDLPFPKAIFHNHAPEPGQHYGTSVLHGAYSPWADKWLNGGALDVRRLFMVKDAYRGARLWYPNEMMEIPGKDEPVPARDIAREIVEQAKTGAVTTLPSVIDPTSGKQRWQWEESVVASNPQHILQYPKDLDTEMLRGMEVPDDIFTADTDSSGAWAGKKVPLDGFYTGLDLWMIRLIKDVKKQLIDPLVAMNFGDGKWYEIEAKPLAEQAMERQQKAGGPQGGPPKPFNVGFGGGDGDDGGRPEPPRLPYRQNGQGQGHKLSLDAAEAVGQGVLDAAELVKAAKSVLRESPRMVRMRADLPAGARWITIGGRKQGDDEHAGGFPVLIDGDGNILRGGPKGLQGKHVGQVSEHFDEVNRGKRQERYQRQSEQEAANPAGRSRSWATIVAHHADKWGVDEATYEGLAKQVWEDTLTTHEERESAKGYARDRLRLTAADINRLENKGLDSGSAHQRIKGLDVVGRELASLYPGLGWGRGADEGRGGSDTTPYDELIWELIKEGKQELPSRVSREFHERVDEYLESELARHRRAKKEPAKKDDTDWSKVEFSLERATRLGTDFEAKHPRDDEGKFAESGSPPKPLHHMTRSEFRTWQNTPKLSAIRDAIKAGKRIVSPGQWKNLQLNHPDGLRISRSGDVQIYVGKNKWAALTDPHVDILAEQAGMNLPERHEKVYHHVEIENALAAGEHVPPEVLAEYPDLIRKPDEADESDEDAQG